MDRLRIRAERIERANNDLEARAAFIELCRRDPAFWLENTAWTYDPRRSPAQIPFLPYDFQTELFLTILRKIDAGEDGLLEKSRDMGATWIGMYAIQYKWQFDPDFNALVGSRKAELVDKADSQDCLFWKILYNIGRQPKWLLPKGWDQAKNKTYMLITNPQTGATIKGESANPDFSRQGRYKFIWLDEFAFWQWGSAVWQATADAAPCRFVVSTPNTRMDKFARLRHGDDGEKIDTITLHWRQHPLKDTKWYDLQKTRRTPEEVAQELDISYQRSVRSRVYPELDDVELGEFDYDDKLPLFVSWDFGSADGTALIWVQVTPTGKVRIIDAYYNRNKTIDFYVPFVSGKIVSGLPYQYEAKDLEIIQRHDTWVEATHFGDPAGNQKHQTNNLSVIEQLRKFKIHIYTNARVNSLDDRITATKLLMRRMQIDKRYCQSFFDAISNARYPERREDSQATTPNRVPIHDWTSHYRTALEYYAVNAPRPGVTRTHREKRDPITGRLLEQ